MKRKALKLLSIVLSNVMIFGTVLPASAYNLDENHNSIESVEYQNTQNNDFTNTSQIFAELASIYKVTIPKTVVLSGESKDASYFVKVEGDIAGYEQISVIPDESFNLYTKKKDPQKAFVSQDKTIWHVSDFDIDANGTIKANTITAGKWSGVFYFNINLEDGEKVAGDIIIPPDLPLDDDYRLIIEKISDAPGLYDDNFTLILPWPEIAKRIEGGETISQIVNSCPGGVYLSIPQGTSTIPTNYLPGTNIKYIYVPDTVTTIQTTSCPGSPIKGVFLPKSTKVEPGAFDNTPAGVNKQVYVGGQRIVDTIIDINTLPEREEDIKDEDALILEKGCKYQITALYNFYDDVTKQSTIKSSNPDIVRFIPECTLEALEVGTSIISGKYFGPLGERNAYLLVKVIDTGYSKGSVPSNTHRHVVGPLQEENKVPATCTEDGHVDQVFYCSDCNKELGRRTVPIYATGHVAGEWVVVKEATENETGLKEQRCTVCNELLDGEEIPMTQHADFIEVALTTANRDKIGWESSTTNLVIPEFYTDNGQKYRITSIGSFAFSNCTSLTSVTIPNSVTSIDGYTFSNCTSLKSVTIPNSVTSIGSFAFGNCTSLTSVTIPNSVTSISNAFSGCKSLTSVTIPNSVTSIDGEAFSGCKSLTSVTIPNSVTSIGNKAFYNCSLKSVTIPNSVTSIGREVFSGCTSLTSVTIPNSVTSIGGYTFSNCTSLKSVTIPNSVTSIGESVFQSCTSLTSVTIPNSVTSISERMFNCCKSLKSVTIPNSVKTISSSAFYKCTSLTSITIPNSVTSIGYNAFSNCTSLTSIAIPDSVTSIDGEAFSGCKSLTSITYRGVTYTDKTTFNNKLKSDGVTTATSVWN